MSRADLAIEMRQSFLIKICLLQCYQFSLVPCNVLQWLLKTEDLSHTFRSDPSCLGSNM